MTHSSTSIQDAIQKAIHGEIERIIEDEIAIAQENIKKRVRQMLPNIVMLMFRHFTFNSEGMTIRVEFKEENLK